MSSHSRRTGSRLVVAAAAKGPDEDKYTTATTEPLGAVDLNALRLITPGTLTVGTLSDAPTSWA